MRARPSVLTPDGKQSYTVRLVRHRVPEAVVRHFRWLGKLVRYEHKHATDVTQTSRTQTSRTQTSGCYPDNKCARPAICGQAKRVSERVCEPNHTGSGTCTPLGARRSRLPLPCAQFELDRTGTRVPPKRSAEGERVHENREQKGGLLDGQLCLEMTCVLTSKTPVNNSDYDSVSDKVRLAVCRWRTMPALVGRALLEPYLWLPNILSSAVPGRGMGRDQSAPRSHERGPVAPGTLRYSGTSGRMLNSQLKV
eukprot:scaffold9141_cov70-Phaeocystis_antarctica.AAC.1